MTYACEILADSMSPAGHRLTTFQVTFPRFILAEVNTHRQLSRNSASSRAIPVEKRIAAILDNPFVPDAFAANQRGMQAGEKLDANAQENCRYTWLAAMDDAVSRARQMVELGVHKQWANRLLEPYAWHTAIISGTEWDNVWSQRISPDAQPEFCTIATMMRDAYDDATCPTVSYLMQGQWHLPLVGPKYGDTLNTELAVKISTARCARVSYLTHAGIRDPYADLMLYDGLVTKGHMSPLEHPARPMTPAELSMGQFCGNFRGWVQHRKEIAGEAVFEGGE